MPDYDAQRQSAPGGAAPERAPNERKAADPTAAAKGQSAEVGAAGTAVLMPAFPHAGAIERSTGQALRGKAWHDPDGVQKRGVEAYTDGDDVHFGMLAPTLRVAAHEATHLLQNQGRTNDAGFGAERHAEVIANIIVAGGRAEPLIGQYGSPVARGLHPYTRYTVANQKGKASNDWGAGNAATHDMLVADDGNLAMYDTGYGNQKTIYASIGVLLAGMMQLKAQKSKVAIGIGGGHVTGKAPADNGARKLYEVAFSEANSANALKLGDDCGLTMNQVTGGHNSGNVQNAVMRDQGGTQTYATPKGYYGNMDAKGNAQNNTPQDWLAEIMQLEYGTLAGILKSNPRQVQELMKALGGDNMAKNRGLDEYAVPDLGQGMVTMADTQATGHKYANHGGNNWNFHFGTNVLKSGADWGALENWTGHGQANWFVYLYGPANKAQTWHEIQTGHNEFGNITKSMVTEPTQRRLGKATKIVEIYAANDWAMSAGKLAVNDTYGVVSRGAGWRSVVVLSGGLKNTNGYMKDADFEQG